MTNTFLESFDLKSSKDRKLLKKVQQEPGVSASAETCAYANLPDKELLQAWREAECAKGAEAVNLRVEIIRRGLTPDQ
jgi:hypothetical protein